MAIDVNSIIQEFCQYYLSDTGNMDRLQRVLTLKSHTLSVPGIKHLQVDDTVYQAATLSSTETVQPFQKSFDPAGKHTFMANPIPLQHIKVDQQFYPHDIYDNWLGFLAGSGNSPEEWPIVRYLLEEVIASQIEADRERWMVYLGKNLPHVKHPLAAMDGLRTVIYKHRPGNGNLPEVQILNGALNLTGNDKAKDLFDSIEEIASQIPSTAVNEPLIFFVAPTVERLYQQAKRTMGMYYDYKDDRSVGTSIDFTPFRVYGCPSMALTPNEMFATPASNILHLTKRSYAPSTFDIQTADRLVKVLGDWSEGVGFADPSRVFVLSNEGEDEKSFKNLYEKDFSTDENERPIFNTEGTLQNVSLNIGEEEE